MCTHNQCFRAKKKSIIVFNQKINIFYGSEILLYIAWAYSRNVKTQEVSGSPSLCLTRSQTPKTCFSCNLAYILAVNDKDADQTVHMPRLICTLVLLA